MKVAPGRRAKRTKVQNKRFIPKLMALCAVGRPVPEFDFDGKIGKPSFNFIVLSANDREEDTMCILHCCFRRMPLPGLVYRGPLLRGSLS